MQRLSAIVSGAMLASSVSSRLVETSLSIFASKGTFSTFSNRKGNQNFQKEAVRSDFLKWVSVGFFRAYMFATGFTPLQPKPLESIMDIGRAKNKSPEDLASIWDDYHLGRGHIGASMKAKLYRLLEQRAADCQYFVIPLWRGSGYTTMFAQVKIPHMMFTSLEDYKARGTQASPYLTVCHYTEFAKAKAWC